MSNVTPAYIEHRQQHTYRLMNPIPYYAQYHGHKLHLDQNEKLIRFGVTHVAASDGYSGKLLGIISMPVISRMMNSVQRAYTDESSNGCLDDLL